MRLRQPTDFLILEALHSFGRNVAPNVAQTIGKSRKNVNNRLPTLADYGLVQKVGPAERAGLYEITERGRIAVRLQEEYEHGGDFDALVERRLQADREGVGDAEESAARAVARSDEGEDVSGE